MTSLPVLDKSLNAWGTPAFREVLKQEIEQLEPTQLPLQEGLRLSSHVADSSFTALILSVDDDAGCIHAKAGIVYAGIIAGCSCADDPTPISEQSEYCEVMLTIDKQTAATHITLLAEEAE